MVRPCHRVLAHSLDNPPLCRSPQARMSKDEILDGMEKLGWWTRRFYESSMILESQHHQVIHLTYFATIDHNLETREIFNLK